MAVFEEARGGVAVAAFGRPLDFADEGFVDGVSCHGLEGRLSVRARGVWVSIEETRTSIMPRCSQQS